MMARRSLCERGNGRRPDENATDPGSRRPHHQLSTDLRESVILALARPPPAAPSSVLCLLSLRPLSLDARNARTAAATAHRARQARASARRSLPLARPPPPPARALLVFLDRRLTLALVFGDVDVADEHLAVGVAARDLAERADADRVLAARAHRDHRAAAERARLRGEQRNETKRNGAERNITQPRGERRAAMVRRSWRRGDASEEDRGWSSGEFGGCAASLAVARRVWRSRIELGGCAAS